jgi:hypothetical protein
VPRWGSIGWRWGPRRSRVGRWRGAAAAAAIAALLGSAGPALGAYQGSVYSNWTAFNPCLGIADSYPDKMRQAALSAFAGLGFASTSFTKTGFTETNVLSRTPSDWAVYVHSHGDFYDGQAGFRADGGVCSGSVVHATEIGTRRPSTQQTNLVVMSTCHLGENVAKNNMPGVYGIEKLKAGSTSWRGPEFYLGYIGTTWDNDQWEFEVLFWDALAAGRSVGSAFDTALADGSYASAFDADWFGSYTYRGWPGPYSGCSKCL